MDIWIEVSPGDKVEYKLRGRIDPGIKKRGVGTVLKVMSPYKIYLYGKTYLVRPDGRQPDIVVATDEILRILPTQYPDYPGVL